jgi:hypothetical protein
MAARTVPNTILRGAPKRARTSSNNGFAVTVRLLQDTSPPWLGMTNSLEYCTQAVTRAA